MSLLIGLIGFGLWAFWITRTAYWRKALAMSLCMAVLTSVVVGGFEAMSYSSGELNQIGGDNLGGRIVMFLFMSPLVYPMAIASILKNGGVLKDWILLILPMPLGILVEWTHRRMIASART
jgi:hypothetical protein